MGILEEIIQLDIEKDPTHIGSFSPEEIQAIIKDHTPQKLKSLFDW